MRKSAFTHTLKFLISIILLSFLIFNVGFQTILTHLSHANVLLLLAVVLLLCVELFLSSLILYLLITKGLQQAISFPTAIRQSLARWCVSLLTPGKISDISLLYFLKKNNVSLSTSTAFIYIENLAILIVVLLFSFISILYFYGINFALFLLLTSLLLLLGITLLLRSHKLQGLLRAKFFKNIVTFVAEFSQSVHTLTSEKKTFFFQSIILLLGKWFLLFFNIYIGFKALNFNVPYFFTMLVVPLSRIASFLPVTINGLGVRESVAVYFFGRLGINNGTVVSTYLLLLVINYLLGAVFMLLLPLERDAS